MKIKSRDARLFLQIEMFMLPDQLMRNTIFSIVWYGVLFVIIGLFLVRKITKKSRFVEMKSIWLLALYMVVQTFCTYLNSGPWIRNILSMAVVFVMCCLFETTLKENAEHCLTIFKHVLLMNIVAELTVYLLVGASILGSIACGYVYYVVWATVSLLLTLPRGKRNREIVPVSIIYVFVTIVRPQIDSTGTNNYEWTFYVIVILFLVFTLFENAFSKAKKILNGRVIFAIIIALNLIFVIFSVQDRIPFVRFIIEDIMHKDIGLTGRTSIWDLAKRLILVKPIYGYGTGLTTLADGGRWYDFIRRYGPHNQFLYIMLAGGVVTLIPYLILLIHVFFSLGKKKQYLWSMILSLGLLSMYLELMVTYRTYANCMPLFALFTIIEFMCKNEDAIQSQKSRTS